MKTYKHTYWTTVGSCRCGCGHRHRTPDAAAKCVINDAVGCRRQGADTDRRVIIGDAAGEREIHHVDAERLLDLYGV